MGFHYRYLKETIHSAMNVKIEKFDSKFSHYDTVVEWKNRSLQLIKDSKYFPDWIYQNFDHCSKIVQKSKTEFLKSIGCEVVLVSKKDLKLSFENLSNRLTQIAIDKALAASISILFSGAWESFSGTPILESSVSLAALSAGGIFILHRTLESERIKKFAALSILSDSKGPSVIDEINDKIRQTIFGANPRICLTRRGLEVFGPLGNKEFPSSKQEEALLRISSLKKIVIPASVLSKDAAPLIGNLSIRWVSTASLPLAFFGLISTFYKNSKDRSLLDYVTCLGSGYYIYRYFSAESISEIRKKFSFFLNKGKTSEEILKLLIDGNDLHEAMSFLKQWIKDAKKIGVMVDWKGDLILFKNTEVPFLTKGLYFAQTFPREKDFQEKQICDDHEEKLLFVLGGFLTATCGIIFLKRKISAENQFLS